MYTNVVLFLLVLSFVEGCNSGSNCLVDNGAVSQKCIGSQPAANEQKLNSMEQTQLLQNNFFALGRQRLNSKEYAQKLAGIKSPYTLRLARYYARMKPLKTVFIKDSVFDCISFEDQEGIIDLPEAQKQQAIHYANIAAHLNFERLQLPENHATYLNMLLSVQNGCPFYTISQIRPSNPKMYISHLSNSAHADNAGTNFAWSDIIFPANQSLLSVDMNTQPDYEPGSITPNVFFAADNVNTPILRNPKDSILNVQWLTNSIDSGQSIEFGWQTWSGVLPFLFSYGNTNNWADGWPGNIPVVLLPNVPYPLNQANNYQQSLALYYIISSKNPNNPVCPSDPAGCYALQVASSNQGIRTSGFWNIGYYSKSYFKYQGFTQWHFGLEIQCATPQRGTKCYQPICAAGAFYNGGTHYLADDEHDYSIQNFTKAANGINSTWSTAATPEGKMEFSGCGSLEN